MVLLSKLSLLKFCRAAVVQPKHRRRWQGNAQHANTAMRSRRSQGHLVREVDAAGGLMAAVADHSGTMFHVLNASKGAAVQVSPRQFHTL